MPVGTGAATLSTIPDVPFVVDPTVFFAGTEKNEMTIDVYADPGAGGTIRGTIPRQGVVSKLWVFFDGTLTVTAAGSGQTLPVPGPNWPHGILQSFVLAANGQNNLWDVDGVDLACLRYVRWPAFQDHVSVFPGAQGGGGSALAAGSYPISVAWEIPIAMDDTSLVASLFAQSSSVNLRYTVQRQPEANLIGSGTAALWALSGNFTVRETFWEIPVSAKGELVLPDVSRIHTVFGVDTDFTGTGDQYAPLVRTAGQMERLFCSGMSAPATPLRFDPSAPKANLVDSLTLQYGGTQKPQTYSPAHALLNENDQWYGGPVPYDRAVFDFVRLNPQRDVVFLQGVTELKVDYQIDSAVAVTNPGAYLRCVQEVLI